MTPSTSRWLWMPAGPSSNVGQAICGPSGVRSGATALLMASVTDSEEFGLMTKVVRLMRSFPQPQ